MPNKNEELIKKQRIYEPEFQAILALYETQKQPYKPARRVITGIFSQKQQKKAEPAKEEPQLERKAKGPKKYSPIRKRSTTDIASSYSPSP